VKSVLDRRSFLRSSAGALGIPASLAGLFAACSDAGPIEPDSDPGNVGEIGGYGPVTNDAGVLRLPVGFHMRAFGATGQLMSDGRPTPIAHDGMGAFAYGRSTIRLVRNHEDRNSPPWTPIGPNPYDRVAGGGTTTLEIGANRELLGSWVSLSGTWVNCAGGATPWGSWLSCEETVAGPNEGFEKTHGWVFEVPAAANAPVAAVPYKAMGRFSHEAVCVDPRTGIVYLTEDNGFPPGSGLYRFLPNQPGQLGAGGRLQMARVVGSPRLHIRAGSKVGIEVGDTVDIDWVDIPAVDPGDDPAIDEDTRLTEVFMQGYEQGGAVFNRLEGCSFADGSMFFHDTRGGASTRGHVWQYQPAASEGQGGEADRGLLRSVFESPGTSVLNNPDNITATPRGGLILCEDGGDSNWLRGIDSAGQIFDFAMNQFSRSEFAGVCFSPDGQTLFVNLQGASKGVATRQGVAGTGMTIAIWGPWQRGEL
jgi:secreted PhoX family phosphatase